MEVLEAIWPHVAGALTLLISILASAHAVLFKRDVRSAAGWFGLIWLVPLVGAVLYILLGINRIQRRAGALLAERQRMEVTQSPVALAAPTLDATIDAGDDHLYDLVRVVDRVTPNPLTRGNLIEPLIDGDGAYPAMLDAIESATRSVTLCTYIFDNDQAGHAFKEALVRARERGVEVRVLIDSVGSRYSFPPMTRVLRRAGIPTARFLPTLLPWRVPYFNLRNHRKSLVVDGRIAFTGGMNIRVGHWLSQKPRYPTRDLHFRLEGPIVSQLQVAFIEDWTFTTGEVLEGEPWLVEETLESKGPALARSIPDGPDEDLDRLRWTLFGGLSAARRSVRVITPYFIPDQSLISELCLSSMRGVQVDIILPERGNLRAVQWASTAQLWQVLAGGCNVMLSPPPFDHTKLMIVDETWVLFGSANWDPRSLRLNFELNVEAYAHGLASRMVQLFDERAAKARKLTKEEVDSRSLPVRMRDGLFRLFAPYL